MSAIVRSKTHRNFRWMLIAAMLLALVAGIAYALQQRSAKAAQAAQPTATVELGDLEKSVTAVGTLKAKEYVDVGTQVSGRVEKIHVAIGEKVKKGQLIAEIDPTVYASTVRKDEATLDNLRAQLAQRQAERELSRLQLARNQQLAAEQAVSRDVLQQASASTAVAEATVAAIAAQIKAAEATLAGNRANLGYTKIYSPMAGSVVVQDTREGQTVNSSQSVAVIAQVAKLDVMTVWAQVAEADVNKIAPGMPVYFTTLGEPGRKWRGTVQQVQPTPTTTNDVVLYYALVDVANPEQKLLPAMTVQAFFVQAEASNVPMVPIAALKPSKREGEGQYVAMVLTDKGPERRRVQTGVVTRSSAQILSGLKLGEKVLLPAQSSDGRKPAASERQRGRMPNMGPRL